MVKIFKKLCVLLMAVTVTTASAKEIYGFMTGSGNVAELPIGMYKFDTQGASPAQLEQSVTMQLWGGAYAAGTYYMILSDDYQGYLCYGLCTYDISTKQTGIGGMFQSYGCTDMTYDCTANTMYGVICMNGGEKVEQALITINLTDGSRTEVGKLSTKVAALACDAFGNMVAMTTSGMLCRVNKADATLTEIGPTGVATNNEQAQSMEYDRDEGKLYWSGLDSDDNAFFAELDPATGTVVTTRTPQDNALIVGLHIPYGQVSDDAPAAAMYMGFMKNGNEVTITWTNPLENRVGQDLTMPLTKAEVYRDGRLVHTIEAPVAGDFMSWTDRLDDGVNGKLTYTVYLYNEAGKSEGASIAVMVGEDVPAAVTNVTVTKTANGAAIAWTAPTTGTNGGTINPDNISYKVTRQSDGLAFDTTKETSISDETQPKTGYYWYEVEAANASGSGPKATSDIIALGESVAVPYTADWTKAEEGSFWLVQDLNGDGTKWSYNQSEGNFMYFASFTNKADDRLLSVPFSLKKGAQYTLSYSISASSFIGSSERFRLSMGHGGEETEMDFLDNYSNTEAETRTVPFTVAEDGDYTFMMDALSDADQFAIYINSFAIETMLDTDLALASIIGDTDIPAGTEATVDVDVKNNGIKVAAPYTITLTDQQGNTLANEECSDPLQAGMSSHHTMSWTAAEAVTAITATVTVSGDQLDSNNSQTIQVNVIPAGERYIEMGKGDMHPTLIPFSFEGYLNSCSQTIYRKSETGGGVMEISEVKVPYNNTDEPVDNCHIKLFMANTLGESVADGWMLEEDMQQVFDGAVSFNKGAGEMVITLGEPFVYDGTNLMMMWQKLDDPTFAFFIKFQGQDFGEDDARTAIYYSDGQGVNLDQVQASSVLCNLKMRVKDVAYDGISGVDGSQIVSATYTDLAGRRVATPKNGIYVKTVTTTSGEKLSTKVVVR